jgi:hypothetical protein
MSGKPPREVFDSAAITDLALGGCAKAQPLFLF